MPLVSRELAKLFAVVARACGCSVVIESRASERLLVYDDSLARSPACEAAEALG